MEKKQDTENRLMSVAAVAETLSVSPRQVWRLAADGKLPRPVKLGRRLTRFYAGDVQTYLAALRP